MSRGSLQTGLRCPKCGNATNLNIRNDTHGDPPELTTVECYSHPCGYCGHLSEFIVKREVKNAKR